MDHLAPALPQLQWMIAAALLKVVDGRDVVARIHFLGMLDMT